MRSEGV